MKLEMEIQSKEGQLETTKATEQLNTEKLLHDHRMLTEREGESAATLAQQKKKLSKLKDVLHTLTAKYEEHDGREKKRHEELTQECLRLTKQYKDLQHRFRHFECADRERYDKVRLSSLPPPYLIYLMHIHTYVHTNIIKDLGYAQTRNPSDCPEGHGYR